MSIFDAAVLMGGGLVIEGEVLVGWMGKMFGMVIKRARMGADFDKKLHLDG